MSMKQLFLTHEADNMGKKLDYLPVTGATCNQNSGFLCMTGTSGAQR
jgi:hypothetical protein